jgi:hypothetical protein
LLSEEQRKKYYPPQRGESGQCDGQHARRTLKGGARGSAAPQPRPQADSTP